MAHEWHRGVLTSSSWHGLESVEALPDADVMIRRGEETGAWPVATMTADLLAVSESGERPLRCPGQAVVARYADGSVRAIGAVGSRYVPLRSESWRSLVRDAVTAGARPAGCFSLRGGRQILATFDVTPVNSGEIKTHLNIVDCLDGSGTLRSGDSSVRVVCANTLQAWHDTDGRAQVKIRHTDGIHDRVDALRAAITDAIASGSRVHAMYDAARAKPLTRPQAEEIFAALFPEPSADVVKDQPRKAANMLKARKDATAAMKRPENYAGATLATLWNGATWTVDRTAEGGAKRSSDPLDSMLFGARGQRVAEIERIVAEVLGEVGLTPTAPAPGPVADDDLMGAIASQAALAG